MRHGKKLEVRGLRIRQARILGLTLLCGVALGALVGLPWKPAQNFSTTPQVEFAAAAQAAPETAGTVPVQVRLSSLAGSDVTVPYAVSGSAASPGDYTVPPGPLVIPAGQLVGAIAVTLADDATFEADETVVVTLGTPQNADPGAVLTHVLTIQEDEPPPSVTFVKSASARDEDAGTVALAVTLSAPAAVDVTVPFQAGGTATNPSDYTTSANPLVIPAGSTQAALLVNVVDDATKEPGGETLTVVFTSVQNATLGAVPAHTLKIRDDDGPYDFGGVGGLGPVPPSVQVLPTWLDFGAVRAGESAAQTVVVVNNSDRGLTVTQALLAGGDPADFQVAPQTPLPAQLARGDSVVFDVTFAPTDRGPRQAYLYLKQSPKSPGRLQVALSGVGLGPIGAELLVDCGGPAYVDPAGGDWAGDYGYGPLTGLLTTAAPIAGTPDPTLYRTARLGLDLRYDFLLPDGTYDVDLHFAEIVPGWPPAARVFDVLAEGQLLIDDLDLSATVGVEQALVQTFRLPVADGQLNVQLVSQTGHALLSAIQARAVGLLDATPPSLVFPVLDAGESAVLNLVLDNAGLAPVTIDTLRILNVTGDSQDMSLVLDGTTYAGNPFDSVYQPGAVLPGGTSTVVPVTFAPTEHAQNLVTLSFEGAFGVEQVQVNAISGFGGDPFLHPVLVVPPLAVDYDADGTASVLLDGSGSHTHEPGKTLTAWEWSEGGAVLATQAVAAVDLALGLHTLDLTIWDDNVPPRSLTGSTVVDVVATDDVPGVLALYHPAAAGGAAALLDAPPANAQFAEVRADFAVAAENGVGGSGLAGDVLVELLGQVDAPLAATWVLTATGGVDRRLFLDGAPVQGPVAVGPGRHDVEARFAVDSAADLPLAVLLGVDGAPPAPVGDFAATHDLAATPPVVNDMPAVGTTLGGNQIVIDGFGFYPQAGVTVHWGGLDLTQADFVSWSANRIELLSPPGTGTIAVTVETPNGTSNVVTFDYQQDGPVPINFFLKGSVTITQPTAAAWGPDGRLWVVNRPGRLTAITFDDSYNVLGVSTYDGVSGLTNPEAMGIAFDPFDVGSPIRVYVAHNEMYAQGGLSFTGPSPYPAQVSVLTGPTFDAPVPVVTGLPGSNHDHGVNGLVFDHRGDLLITSGGNTNAGVAAPLMGDLPESPLSGAILKAETSRPDFSGALSYVETATGTPNADQVSGEAVDLAPGTHVHVHAAGLRNPFDLCLATNGRLYATDNGPNDTFGPASTGATTQTSWDPTEPDELNLIEYGHYYGHPNRGRGRYVPIENAFRDTSAPDEPGFTQCLTTLYSSQNGVAEYRADAFGGQMRGDLLTQKFGAVVYRVELAPDGRAVQKTSSFSWYTNALGLVTGPGGAILPVDYLGNKVRVYLPNDLAVNGMTPYDITPWRAPRTGGATTAFVIGGENFGTLADTTVKIGGVSCFLTGVTPRRIRGWVPALGVMDYALQDVVVTSNGSTRTLAGAFRWLDTAPGLEPGRWEAGPDMPLPAGEVACGVVGGTLYLVGEGNALTYAYDLVNGSWSTGLAPRPFAGHHHAAEVVGGKWYLIGGLGAGMGRVQVYDPATDSWSLGADLPWAGGSVSTAAIGGKIYASGGIVGSTTVDDCAAYDPAADAWTARAPMPAGQGRNHAAAGTDGTRFWVLGGRGVGSGDGNWVADGFADVQVYDPATDAWASSADPGSGLSPMPIGRGGTGKAVWYQDELWVFGGETLTGPGATGNNVYARVDRYDPATDTWRTDAPMPTPRHGVFPVVYQGAVWVAGGGVVAGFSASDALEVFRRE